MLVVFWFVNLYSLLVYIEHNGDESLKDSLLVQLSQVRYNKPKTTEDGGDNADDTEKSLILINAPSSTVTSYSAGKRKCSFHFLC